MNFYFHVHDYLKTIIKNYRVINLIFSLYKKDLLDYFYKEHWKKDLWDIRRINMHRIEVKLPLRFRIYFFWVFKVRPALRKVSGGLLFSLDKMPYDSDLELIPEDDHMTKVCSFSMGNRALLEKDGRGVCYQCKHIVYTNHITEYYTEPSGKLKGEDTAICPHCEIDSIVPMSVFQGAGLKLNRHNLTWINIYAFGPTVFRQDDLVGMDWKKARLCEYAYGNKEDVLNSERVGCIYCKQIFKTAEVLIEFVDSVNNDTKTALCPNCNNRKLLDEFSVSVEKEMLDTTLLETLHDYIYVKHADTAIVK